MTHQYAHDALVIGSGAAGLSLALHLADKCQVAVICKDELTEGATLYAQGGISAVMDRFDSIESHVNDTLNAGAGLCNPDVVHYVAENAKKNIEWLIDLGVEFTRESSSNSTEKFHLNQEGGHSHRRILHAEDSTGRAIETTLDRLVRAHPNIEIFENHIAVDLISSKQKDTDKRCCQGAYVYDSNEHKVRVFRSKFVILASGGAGKVYLYTSNPDVSTGDGIAMAARAGCRIANMEFIQFHPTCLYHPEAKSFLISEALRGEGAKLTLANGERFLHRFDEREELAPRDIVARAIDHEMKRLGQECVYLDITHQSKSFITEHFPTIYQKCLDFGFELDKQAIPVVPAAHYTCGGVMVDQNGRTDLQGLYAIGEVCCSGLHGANRMASNSLLECVVYAHAAYQDIQKQLPDMQMPAALKDWDESQVTDSDEEVVVSHNWDEIRRFMWDYVGIVRTSKRLQRAKHRIDLLTSEIHEYYGNFRLTKDLIELRNLALNASLIIESALSRQESRGLHYTLDYPDTLEQSQIQDTVLKLNKNLNKDNQAA